MGENREDVAAVDSTSGTTFAVGSGIVAHADLELLGSSSPPASASYIVGTTDISDTMPDLKIKFEIKC